MSALFRMVIDAKDAIIDIHFNSDVQLVFAVPKGCHNVSLVATTDFGGQANLYCLPSNPEVPVGVSSMLRLR